MSGTGTLAHTVRREADDSLTGQIQRLREDRAIAVLEGFHAVKHAVRFGAEIELAITADIATMDAMAAELAPDVRGLLRDLVRPVEPELIALAARRVPHTGVVAFARRPAHDLTRVLEAAAGRPIVLLEDPRDLGNLGAVVRVAAAADAGAVLVTGDRDPWDPSAIRGSAGLHFALPVLHAPAVPAGDRPLVAVDPGGAAVGPMRIPAGAVLAFGTERHGLSSDILDAASIRVRIPMRAGVSSLNLATAVAVVLYADQLLSGR